MIENLQNMIFARLLARLRPRKTSKCIKTVLHTILKRFFSILRGRMTNSGNEREFYSAHFETYVGFQNGV